MDNQGYTRITSRLLMGAASLLSLSQAFTPDAALAAETIAADEIVVTAQKREQRLLDVPISISALGEEELAREGSRNLQDIARTVPGLMLIPSSRGFGGTPVIRGIAAIAGAPTVGIYIDDVPIQGRPSSFAGNPDPRLFDIERVEVLRGPQGTLYGASSMGGTIRYLTRAPSFTDYSGKVKAEVSAIDGGGTNVELAGAVGGPIVEDTLAIRASALYRRDGGFVERVDRITGDIVDSNIDTTDTFVFRVAATWRAAEGLEIEPAFYYQRAERDDLPQIMGALPGTSQFNTSKQPGRDRFYVPSLTVRYDFGPATLTSVTSILRNSQKQAFDYSTLQSNAFSGTDFLPVLPPYISVSESTVAQKDFSQEVRITSNDEGPFSWIVGGFYRRTKDHFKQFVADFGAEPMLTYLTGGLTFEEAIGLPLLPGSGVYQGDTRGVETQLAGFGEVTYAITPQLKATAGVRVSRAKLEYDRFTQGPLNGGVQTVSGSQTDSPVTPKFSVNYEISDNAMTYVTVQKGFRVGGVNPPVPLARCAADLAALGGTPAEGYSSDGLWSYELGAKAQLFERKLSINAAVYQIDWKDIQQPVSLPGCGFGYTDNMGEARSRGFELETVVKPVPDLSFGLRVGHVNAELTQDLLAPVNPTTGTRGTISRKGDKIVGVPEWTVSLNGEYVFAAGDDVEFYIRGDYQWIDKHNRTQPFGRIGYNAVTFEAESYDRASARIGATITGGWEAAVFIDNITNNRPELNATTALSPATRILRYSTLQPRTIGLSVTRQF